MPAHHAAPANLDAEHAACLDCQEPFEPKRRWGANPGVYRRCESCLEGKRYNRKYSKPVLRPKTKSYLKIQDYLFFRARHEVGDLALTDKQIAEGTQLSRRTVTRIIRQMRRESFLETTTTRVKLNDDTWVVSRSIHLNVLPLKKEEA
jgi:hypothetical protein